MAGMLGKSANLAKIGNILGGWNSGINIALVSGLTYIEFSVDPLLGGDEVGSCLGTKATETGRQTCGVIAVGCRSRIGVRSW